MSKPILIVGGVIILGLGGLLLFQSPKEQEDADMMDEGMMEEVEEMMPIMGEGRVDEMMVEHTVVYSEAGYAPKELTIKKGERVTFRNESSKETWPASAMHPSHAAYPGSSIGKCGTAEEDTIFDACRGLKQGEEWSFIFDQVGTWGYHDHMNSSMYGKIMVQE